MITRLKAVRRAFLQDPFFSRFRHGISVGGVLDFVLFRLSVARLISFPKIFVLQVGAGAGDSSHDLRRELLEHERVFGLLLEPQRDVFRLLQQNYSGNRNVALENVALGETSGRRTIYRISESANQFHKYGKVFGSGIASFDKEHPWQYFLQNATEAGRKQLKDEILECAPVECTSLGDLVDRYGIETIDILMVDTEGFDFEVLKIVFAGGFRPSLLKYEHKHIPGGRRGVHQSWRFLLSRGYRLVVIPDTGDTVALDDAWAKRLGSAQF